MVSIITISVPWERGGSLRGGASMRDGDCVQARDCGHPKQIKTQGVIRTTATRTNLALIWLACQPNIA